MAIEFIKNHPLSVLKNKTTRTVVVATFCIGFLLGYVSFIVGVIASFHGMRSLIQVIRYRRSFLQTLQWHASNARNKSYITRAIVVAKKKMVDPITGDRQYKIVLEFQQQSLISDKSSKEQESSSSSTATSQFIIQSDEYPIAASEVVRDCPSEGFAMPLHVMEYDKTIPTELYRDRIQDLQLWAQWVDPIVSLVGICLYLFLAFLYAELVTLSSQGFFTIMGMAILSIVLMTPYILLDVRVRHEQRLEALDKNPLAVVTEFEKIRDLWYSLGPTMAQKLKPVMFAVGLLAMAVFSAIGIIPGCWAVWGLTKLTDAKITSQRESLFRLFQRAKKVKGYIVDCFVPEFGQRKKHSVTIRYTAPNGEKVEKKLEHEYLLRDYLQHKSQRSKSSIDDSNPPSVPVDLLVLLDHPCSGYPERNIIATWSPSKIHVVAFVGLFFYMMCFLMNYEDWLPIYYDTENEMVDSLVNDIILYWAPAFIPFVFMMPQTYSFHRYRYRGLLHDVFEAGLETNSI
ncbi:unnamed protein product [Cylindrotheca closterium]|uniref:Uncharacterized protein n=1 Tax=Cylindrotheca closterium TaxID=2856 RepID=A0AAD2CDE6_9STRA|nr:unnamed protein product [Cylindrotheca closterium]